MRLYKSRRFRRGASDQDDNHLVKRLKILQGMKRPVDEENETDNDKRQKLETSGEYSASGLKTSLHGTVYQLKLLMLFMKRGLDLRYEFRLATEMDAADKMDDLVFQYEEGGKQVFRFLQAKHKQNEDKKISVNDFLTETEGEFSLQKYFTTFRSIKNNPMFNGDDKKIRDLIICTNIDYDHDGKKGDLELKNVFDKVRDERGNEKNDELLKTVLIKFKDNFNGRKQIVSVLENSSELIKLAQILADCVLDGKKIDNNKSKNDAGENLFASYQLPLSDEVIDIASKKLRDDFIEGIKLSEEGKSLRNAFEKVFDDRRKSYNIDDNPYIKNEDLGNLAQEIATLMAKDKGSKPVKILRNKNVIKNNIDKLAGHVIVIKDGKKQFSSGFMENNQLPGNLDLFRDRLRIELLKKKIPFESLNNYNLEVNNLKTCDEVYVDKNGFWDEIKDRKLKLFDEFGKSIGNFPKLKLPKDSIADINNDIKSYFDHLVLALKQPSEIALDKIIRDEMGKDKEINLIDSDFLASQFQKEMLDWMKEKQGRFLDYTDGLQFFTDMKSKLASLVLTCPSLEYRAKFEELNIQFNGVETELKNFLDPYNKNQIFNFISPPDTVIGSIKVYQTLKSMPAYKQDDSYIFIRLNSLLRIQDRVADAFNSPSKRLLIIECKPLEETVQESYDELFKVITSNKKIVLITEGNNMLAKSFKIMFGNKYVEKNIEVNSLLDLTPESQSKIMNERKVIFQGEKIVLGKLINVESMKLIDAEALSSLLNEKRLEIAKPLQNLDDVKDYYVPRTFSRSVKIHGSSQGDSSSFYVTYDVDYQFTARNLNNDQDIILITDENRDFEELCDLFKRHNNHWLKKLNNEFIWQKSEGSLSKIRGLVDRSRDNVTPYKPEKVSDIADRIVIVAAEPGMGKSTVLTDLAVKTKTYDPTMWVAKINLLVDCSTELELLVNKRIRFNDGKIVEFLLKITKLDRELDRELFKDFYKRGNMVLLFDGFDEISPHYKSKVIELLTFLKSTRIEKIWVTTRPYNIGNDLEDALSSFSYGIEEFSDVEQRIFLKKLWIKNSKFDDNQLDEIRANIFVDKLLNKFTKSINDRQSKFTSVPLQLKMIADVFIDDFYEFYKSNSDELSDEHIRQFEKNLDMISLYKRFINVKYDDVLFGEKSRGLIKADVKFRDMIDDKREKDRRDHEELALHSLYGKLDAERLLSRESDPKLFKNVENGRDKTGIIVRVIDGRPVFVHQTFAEFYAAVWFAENWKTDAVKQFLSERFYTEINEVTRNFFDRLLARDEDNVYEMHDAALNNNEVKIENLLRNNELAFETFDKAGRTPLHLAASHGFENIVERLLEAASRNQESRMMLSGKDKLFNWSPLSYADRTGHWNVAESLLKNGANGDEMFEAINSIKNGETYRRSESLLHIAAKEGYLEFAKFLLKKGADIDALDRLDKTPLHLSAQNGRLNLVKYFVNDKEARLDPEDVLGNIPLHLAAENGHLDVVKFFVEDKRGKLDARNAHGMVPLHLAAEKGRLDAVEYFIGEKGMDVSIEDEEDQVPLHMAARNGELETVKYLVKMDANLNTVNKIAGSGGTPLHMAAEDGNLEVVKYLMKNGAEFEIVDDSTPLHWAALEGKLEVVRYFLEKENTDIEAPQYDGSTLLHLAALNGHLDVAEYLVNERSANLEAFDNNGRIPLHVAARGGKMDVVKFLADQKSSTINFRDKNGETPSSLAADGFLDVLRYLVGVKNADINTKNDNGQSLLHKASNALEVVQYLCEEKNVNFFDKDNEGSTALHLAARNGRSEVVDYFLERIEHSPGELSQVLFDTEAYGMTPLHYAVLNDHEEVAEALLDFMKNYPEKLRALIGNGESDLNDDSLTEKLLVEKGAKILIRNNLHTILHESVLGNKRETIELIANIIITDHNKISINSPDIEGNTPLIWAAKNNKDTAAKVLMDMGADINAKNNRMETALHLAIMNRHESMIDFLIGSDANIEIEDENGRRALHWAAEEREWGIATTLIAAGANVNVVDKELRVPLHSAAAGWDLSIVKLLADNGADLVAKDENGNTPLHYAIHGGDLQILEYLAEDKGVDLYSPNDLGNTPLHLAAQEGKLTTVNYLLEKLDEDPEKLNELLFDTEKYGMTPLHYAELHAHGKVVDALLSRMRNSGENLKSLISDDEDERDRMEVEGVSRDDERGLSLSGECPPSEGSSTSNGGRRKKRAVIEECVLEWEDVDAFNEEKEMTRNHEEIKIDSGKFINYIKSQSMSETKLKQLVKLADEVQVTGKYQSLVRKFINTEYTMNHLTRMGEFAGETMHGMMTKNTVADLLNRNYQGVAINIGLMAGGRGLAKLAETANNKGLKLISEDEFLLGKSLRASSPFLARGTSVFVVSDLIDQLKSYNSGNKDALVGVVGDGIYLGVDAVEIGVGVAEAFGVLEGVSAVTGPIGAVIGAVVFVGTDIYTTVKKVKKIEDLIDLSAKEKFEEGLRAFMGMQPEIYITKLMQDKEINNQMVKQAFDYLKQHGDIISYVFPTVKSTVDLCQGIDVFCKRNSEVDLDNRVLLDRKISDIRWARAKPDPPISGGDLLCSPEGDHYSVPYDGAYLCRNAIGVTASAESKTGNSVLINLGEGEDYARGFIDGPNIFLVEDGVKNYQGGDMNDTFILNGDEIEGYLHGGGGVDTLDLSSFAPVATNVDIIFNTEIVIDIYSRILRSSGVNRVLGRREKADRIYAACDEYPDNIEFLDGRGGNEKLMDRIHLESENCTYDMKIVLRPYTVVYNVALKGNFSYIVPRGLGRSMIYFYRSVESLSVKNNFIFEYELTEIGNITVKNLVDPYKHNSHLIEFYFSPNSDREYNVTISAPNNPIYRFGNDAELKVGSTGSLYILQNSFDSVAEIIERYFAISNRLKNISFYIQSLSSNETVVIGSGDNEVIHNDPLQKSHLIGSAGENIYVIDSVNRVFEIDKLPLPEVVIYDLDAETTIDVIDLRNLVGQVRASERFSIENDFSELRIHKYGEDLLIKVNVIDNIKNEDSTITTREYFSIRLKQGIYWNNKTQVITDNFSLNVNLDGEIWSLKPVPLIFGKDKEIIIVNNRDVEANSELITPRKLGDYIFLRNNDTDNLVITNAFSTNVTRKNLCTIIIVQFYGIPKMESLSIKFSDKELILKNHREEIYAARDLDTVKKQYNHRIYNNVFGRVKSLNRSAKTAPFRRSDNRKRKSKQGRHTRKTRSCCSENSRNSAARSGYSWINDLFSWMTEKKNTFLTTSSVNINLLTGWFFGSENAAMQLGEREYRGSMNEGDLKPGYSLRSIDFNGGILLTDVVLAKMGNRRLHIFSKGDEGFSELETLGHALRITQEFEDAVEKAALKCGIPASRLDFDFLQIQTEISKRLISGRFTGIDLFLTSHVEKSLAGLSERRIERFMRIVDGSSLSKLIYGSTTNNRNKLPDTVENGNEQLPIRFEPRDSVSTINYLNTSPSKYFSTEVSNALNNETVKS